MNVIPHEMTIQTRYKKSLTTIVLNKFAALHIHESQNQAILKPSDTYNYIITIFNPKSL